jgi:hypothetical protein
LDKNRIADPVAEERANIRGGGREEWAEIRLRILRRSLGDLSAEWGGAAPASPRASGSQQSTANRGRWPMRTNFGSAVRFKAEMAASSRGSSSTMPSLHRQTLAVVPHPVDLVRDFFKILSPNRDRTVSLTADF